MKTEKQKTKNTIKLILPIILILLKLEILSGQNTSCEIPLTCNEYKFYLHSLIQKERLQKDSLNFVHAINGIKLTFDSILVHSENKTVLIDSLFKSNLNLYSVNKIQEKKIKKRGASIKVLSVLVLILTSITLIK